MLIHFYPWEKVLPACPPGGFWLLPKSVHTVKISAQQRKLAGLAAEE